MAYVYLARYERPRFKTICSARVAYEAYLRRIWLSVLATASAEDYDAVESQLRRMLEKAKTIDAGEDEEGEAVRKVVRSVGKELPEGEPTPRGQKRVEECVEYLKEAREEKRTFASLSDPDARTLPVGSSRRKRMGHMLEVAADAGLLVAGGSDRSASDTGRLIPLVEECVADSGYYEGGAVVALQDSGLAAVVPDSTTAGAMRRKPEDTTGEPVQSKAGTRIAARTQTN